ncbi:MFS transporter [Desulforamulus ruminis]|uniref:Major facilitator superfamily MFS_1 n=1 Tax=Desulforamulus ruminis (strain ATCC 23193 / DSM 2154 / NCIMB 8452 / DL) TaxID=696281 RepID=F6DQF2_DESRL|nr:MFS transporter [Desulforamulus ruminis]AEG60846.1 major facilitator superfamily MFS_1 [Desulforamulus ruminis DSM 2154]
MEPFPDSIIQGVKMEQKAPLWTKDFVLICLTNLMVFTSFYFLLPTLPVFVTDMLGGDESNVGYIIGVLSLTAVLVRPLSGFLLDAVGRRKILFFSLVAFSLAMGAYYFVTSLTLLFLLRVLHGLSWGFTTTGAGTVAADVVPPARRGEGLGYYGLSNTLAMALGPSAGLLILDRTSFSMLFIAGFIIAVAGLLASQGIAYRHEVKGKIRSKLSFSDFFEPKVYSLSWIMFFTAVVYGGIVSFITLLGKKIGVGNPGIYFLIYALTLLLVRPYAGKTFDRKGPLPIMAAGFVAIALAFVLLFAARGEWLFSASAVAMGIGFGIVHPTAMAMAINRVEPFRRGAANGTLFSAFDLGIGLGSILLGILSEKVGLSYMYLTCAVIILIPLTLFYLKDAKAYYREKQWDG